MNKKLLFTFHLLFILSCSTGYHSYDFYRGGYSETMLSKNAWRVMFKGNEYTSRGQSEDFVLLRSAELTLKNNYQFFTIEESFTETANSYSTNITNRTTRAYIEPLSTKVIKMHSQKPRTDRIVYDAQFLCDTLGGNYEITCNIPQR